jgi:hypothetical protein
LEYRDGVAPSGAAAAARLQLRLAVVRVRFLARVVRLLRTHAHKPCPYFFPFELPRRWRFYTHALPVRRIQASFAARMFLASLWDRYGSHARTPLLSAA